MPARCGDTEARERLAIVKQGQVLGFGALVLMLATIVTLAAIGQPWVAGIVATTGLAVIVAIFVTGQYQPAPVHIPEVVRNGDSTNGRDGVAQSRPLEVCDTAC
jgi:hypothetical protein